MTRLNHEALALRRFQAIAELQGHAVHTGQNAANRIPIRGGVYYQFGDLRVELPDTTVIVEVESSGGITNLAKYWECYASRRATKPMKLLHLFRQKSAHDYESHLVVWQFLCNTMQAALGNQFEGRQLTYQDGIQASLDPALSIFTEWLAQSPE